MSKAVTVQCFCFTVDGGWDEWGEWSPCSAQCERQRARECTAPAPRHRGKMCEDESQATENCTGGMCTESEWSGVGFLFLLPWSASPSLYAVSAITTTIIIIITILVLLLLSNICQ